MGNIEWLFEDLRVWRTVEYDENVLHEIIKDVIKWGERMLMQYSPNIWTPNNAYDQRLT